jgi:UDP-glucose 4-epimerase
VIILVTGGAGFIGSHVVDHFIDAGYRVVIVDDLSSGAARNINPKAKFYKMDICSSELKSVFEAEKPDSVIHMAAQTVVSKSIQDQITDARINILGSLNIISNCVDYKIQNIIYASSCALYGQPQYCPLDENHPVNPLSPYGVSKHTVEHYLATQRYLNGLSYVALRFANVYGPRQNPDGEGGVVAIFSKKLLSGEQPTIYGQGDKTRDYVYVLDVVHAIVLALKSNTTGIYNVGTGLETLDQTVFDLIKYECNYKGEPLYAQERPGEIKRICLSSNNANKALNWKPQVVLKNGISETVAYYRRESQNSNK